MYAQLCKRLSEEAPNFEPAGEACTFRVLLLNKCKLEFDNRAAVEATSASSSDEDEERRQLAKRKMLGNIKFIGELGKLEILSESILHKCIQELLVRRGDDPSEDLECLCQIMRTCGRILDTHKGQKLMDQYFDRMKSLTENMDLQPRIRFMLKDTIDLRQDGWVPRKATVVEGPMPINQIRLADDDRGGRRHGNNDNSGGDRTNTSSSSSNLSDIFRHPMKTRGGFDDMLMNINFNTSSSPNLISSANSFGSNGFGGQRDGSYRGHNNQRSGGGGGGGGGGYNYNSQRGQYKHNQNNANAQYNNQSNKDLAPRFKKNLIVTQADMGDVELRPASMLFNKASVKTNNMMNATRTNNIEHHHQHHHHHHHQPAFAPSPVKQTSAPLHKEPLPIKQVSSEKPKQSKKDKGPTKDEVLKKFINLLDDYFKGEVDLKQTVTTYKDHKVPEKFAKDALVHGLTIVLDKSDVEAEKIVKLLSSLKESNCVNTSTLQDSFKSFCNVLNERENELDKTLGSMAVLFALAITEELITLSDVGASMTENGAHYPLILLILQQLHTRRGKDELTELFNQSKINLMTQLPEDDKTKERLSEILDERDLTFLYPLLRIQADLARQLNADPNPQSYYKWIRENLDQAHFSDPGFISALMTVLLKYITQEAAAGGAGDKGIAEKEKSMLERYRPILTAFLRENLALQLVAVYSLQVHFFTLGFPKGHLLRWFIALYDLEIIDEEAFLRWKEDVTDAYPAKGQALFEVNQWLTWLQQAESEEESDD